MRVVRVLFGALLGSLLLGILWFGAILQPPEELSRRAAIWAAGGAGEGGPAIAERIPCPVLRRLRFYVVCRDGCETIWRIVGIRGLQPRILADLGRVPPEPPGAARRRINAEVAREGLTLLKEDAREMFGCYLRMDGLDPGLILPPGGRAGVASARGSDQAMLDLESRLRIQAALSRLPVSQSEGEFETRFEYLDTTSPGWPVVGIMLRIAADGRLLGVERRLLE